MPDKFFIHVHLDLPDSVTDMVGNAKAVLAGNDLRIAIEALVKEKAETAVLTVGVQKENLPAPPKAARKPRAPKAPQPIPGMEPSADVDAPVAEPEVVVPPGVEAAKPEKHRGEKKAA